jgi:hypothetical protein
MLKEARQDRKSRPVAHPLCGAVTTRVDVRRPISLRHANDDEGVSRVVGVARARAKHLRDEFSDAGPKDGCSNGAVVQQPSFLQDHKYVALRVRESFKPRTRVCLVFLLLKSNPAPTFTLADRSDHLERLPASNRECFLASPDIENASTWSFLLVGSRTDARARFADRLPTGTAWSYEVKWDGYRGLALKVGGAVTPT